MPAAQVTRNLITDAALEYLTELPSLHRLSLQATRVTDSGLEAWLPELQQLSSLDLSFLDISDAGLDSLSCLKWIEKLNLRHTAVSSAAVVDLVQEKGHSLKWLNLSNTPVHDVTLAEFPGVFNPQNLNLADTAVTDAGLRHLALLNELESLSLSLCDISDDGIRSLAASPGLRVLELFNTRVSDDSLVWLSDSGLQHLGLALTQVSDSGMPTVCDFEKLNSLDLAQTQVSTRGARFLGAAENLQSLYLEDSDVSGEGLKFLTNLPLRTLSMTARYTNTEMYRLAQFHELRHLAVLDHTSIRDVVKRLTKLKTLLLVEPGDILRELSCLRELRFLLLVEQNPDFERRVALRDALPWCSVRFYRTRQKAIRYFRHMSRAC